MAIQAGQAYIQVVPSLRGWQADVRRQLAKELAGVKGKIPIEPDIEGAKKGATKAGQEAGGAFAQSFKKRVEAALKALPDVKIGADSTPAQREIAKIRRELQTLSEKTVGVDIDSGQASAKISQLQARLNRLASENPSVDLDVDIAAASAQLGQIDRQVDRLDGRRANVHVDVDRDGSAQRSSIFLTQSVSGLVLAGGGIAPVFVPAFAAAAAAAAGFASALVGAGAGIGALVAVSIPAFSAVSDAVKATDQAEKAAATSSVNTTRQRVQAAFQAQQSARQVADAQQQADRTSVEGAKRVQDAQRALGDARRDVAERIETANEKVVDSERQLEQAHEAVQRAQEDLTRARKDAIRVLEDLQEQSSDLVLSEEGAEIALIEARQRLAEVNRDGTATLLDRRKATLEVLEAEDRLSDVQRDQRRTSEELNAAERAGINGSELVLAANDRLSDASESLADARRGNIEAQRDLARAEQDGARTIAEAERQVSEARTEAAQANADAARAVGDALQAQAQQAEMARLEAENGVAANRNLAFAMAALTPMQQQLYDGWIRLRDAFKEWAASLEPAVIPLFLEGMGLIERLLPMLTPLVVAAAGAFEYLLDQAEAALASPFWKSFFDFLARVAGPAISGFGDILGNLARGFGGILMAFEPMSMDLTNGLVDLTERFADWGESLGQSEGFQAFVDYVRAVWPDLKATIGAVADAFIAIVDAMAPLGGGPVLSIIRGVADAIADMDPETIQAIALGIGAMALALKAVAIFGALAGLGPVGIAIAILAGIVAIAWVKFEGFREAVRAVVDWFQEEAVPRLEAFGQAIVRVFEDHVRPALEDFWAWFQADLLPVLQDISDVILEVVREIVDWFERNWPRIQDVLTAYVNYLKWAWDTIVFPYLNLLWNILANVVGPVLLWLWHEVAEPAIRAIAAVISWAWQNVISPVFAAVAWTIETILGPVFSWLWTHIIVPVFNGIGAVISFAWNWIILPIFNAIVWVLQNVVGPAFSWLWHEIIEPVWNGIKDALSGAWNWIRDNVFDKIVTFVTETIPNAMTTVKDAILGAFNAVKDNIGGIWEAIWGIVRGGINTVIRLVNGLISGWNALPWVPDIPRIPEIGAPQRRNSNAGGGNRETGGMGRESGGLVPAFGLPEVNLGRTGPFVTNGPRAVVGEGNPAHPEFVIPTDPKYRDRAVNLYSELGAQLLASGGQIGRPKGPGIAGLYNPLATAVAKLLAAANGAVSVVSGWRSNASQTALYHRYLSGQGNLAAKPGTSRHEAGAAVDLGGNRNLYTRLAKGLGLIAPVRGEPWHWEHPGQSGSLGSALGAAAGQLLSTLFAQLKPHSDKARAGLKAKAPGWIRPLPLHAVDKAEEQARNYDTWFNNLNSMFGGAMGLGGSASANRALGQQIASMRGWGTGGQWDALNKLVMSESGWRNTAQNPTSSAYGIGQFLNSTWASVGMRKTSDPGAQIKGMLQYIDQRYDNPIAAWSFKRRNNWYEAGGVLPSGIPSYGNGILRVPHDQLSFVHRDEAVLNPSDAEMFRQATLNAAAGGKGNGYPDINQTFNGLTDPVEIARATGDEVAWQVRVGK